MIASWVASGAMVSILALGLACGGGGADRGLAPRAGEPEISEADAAQEGLDRVGQPGPEWGEMIWLNTEPPSLRDLRGQVVLIRFLVVLETQWEALDRFWLEHGPRRYTSVSFVLDRRGVSRHVHPGSIQGAPPSTSAADGGTRRFGRCSMPCSPSQWSSPRKGEVHH